jgi:pimeloyl-ACP methyl ester carboxylesterase
MLTGSTRRTLLGAAGAVGAAAMVSQTRTAMAQTDGRTFVLVHGAWHGGWCWRRVADRLTVNGHKVFTPTMTGLGERSHLLDGKISLDTHITDIVNVIKWEGLSDIVLVGHSYGGFIITGVAEQMPSVISSIVFLDAFVPDNGQSIADTASRRDRHCGAERRAHDQARFRSGVPGQRKRSRVGGRKVHPTPDRIVHR